MSLELLSQNRTTRNLIFLGANKYNGITAVYMRRSVVKASSNLYKLVVCTFFLTTLYAPAASAVMQCFYQAGTYGNVTVTESGTGCGTFLNFGGITGVWIGDGGADENCQFDISPAVAGSSVEVRMTGHSVVEFAAEETLFFMNGSFVPIVSADIDNSFPSGGVGLLVGTGGSLDPTIGAVSTNGGDGRGTVRFSGAPASVSSINIQHDHVLSDAAGTVYEVCVDDQGSVVAPVSTATFNVTKDFTDDNQTPVEVKLSCNAGLPLEQSFVLTDDASPAPNFSSVTFVVTDFTDGAMDCTVTETPIDNYSASYESGGDSQNDNGTPEAPACRFFSVGLGDANSCAITNTPDPVDFYVDVTWEISDDADVGVGDGTMLEVSCTDGQTANLPAGPDDLTDSGNVGGETCVTVDGVETCTDDPVIYDVAPGESCTAMLSGYDDVTAVSPSSCTVDFTVDGGDESCSFTATAFFEGIPTMSQWGMVLMALLMLGVGYVGMRRFI